LNPDESCHGVSHDFKVWTRDEGGEPSPSIKK
jgi:hypothetical protein